MMVDVNKAIDDIEEKQEKHFTEQERKVLEGFGELLNIMWSNQDNNATNE